MDGSSGPAGLNVFAYTWQFGNGLSATLSAEDSFARQRRRDRPSAVSRRRWSGCATAIDTKGQQVPDIVGNLRVDQAWGSAQIMGACTRSAAATTPTTPGQSTALALPAATPTGCGHPERQVGLGGRRRLDLEDAVGCQGHPVRRDRLRGRCKPLCRFGYGNNFVHKSSGIAVGAFTDAVFASPGIAGTGYDGSIELTKVWGGTVAFEHYWTPSAAHLLGVRLL